MAGRPAVDVDGARLRELRKLAGEDLKGLARRAGITVQYLSQIELGVRPRVSPPAFARICDALGLDDRMQLMAPTVGVPETGRADVPGAAVLTGRPEPMAPAEWEPD